MTNRRKMVRWIGYASVGVGAILVLAGISSLWPTSTMQESASAPLEGVGSLTPTPPSPQHMETLVASPAVPGPATVTNTPEPIVPTPTQPARSASPIQTAEPIVTTPARSATTATPGPTVLVRSSVDSTPAETGIDTAEVELTPTTTPMTVPEQTPPQPIPVDFQVPSNELFRIGVSIPGGAFASLDLEPLGVRWVMDWSVRSTAALSSGVEYAQTVRMGGGTLHPDEATLTQVAASVPGSLWLISNEADVRWQDNVTPEVYAALYHEAYMAIKAGDPTAVVAAGGIAQPTALRMRYLDQALGVYSQLYGVPLPADAWHIHNYMLREERDSWGVDIPPGLPDDTGVLYAISDSGNLAAFEAQIWAFRRWMAERGYGGLPLIISEFGVPMPPDYGFPPERVAAFLRDTWRFMLTAADSALGDPTDGGRLVQRWCWFSLRMPEYPTGDLVGPSGNWTGLARAWMTMIP